ncbi:MAG: penicillin-binding protein 2 [Candidatus Staskawiczbacteria bacterium]|nr:penicillin-binding protein 2 [Candidatus Staskawiczbacteria bacterium]
MNWRLKLFLSLIFLIAAIIIVCLFYMQVVKYKFYQAQALGQQSNFAEVSGLRGKFFFENSKASRGNSGSGGIKSLAINKYEWQVFATPQKIKDKASLTPVLAGILDISEESVKSKLEKSGSYVVIKKELSDTEVNAVKELAVSGLSLEVLSSRYYPQETMLAQVTGFLGGDNTGQYGLEGYYNDILQGKDGIKEEKRGFNIISSQTSENLNGSDLYLTIDYNIQLEAENLLKEAHQNIDIDSGQIIVMKPDSGRILALANFPSFNVNEYSKENFLVFQNSAIQKLFEPGSVFKPFTMAMVLQEGKVTPSSTFIDTGSVKIGPDTVRNFDQKVYGKRDMSGILEKSINTGAVFIAQKLPKPTFINYLKKLGFDDKTGIDLQGEVYSENSLLKKGSDFGFATASFGQGIEMTPIQLASAFCIFANDGKMVKPYIVEKIVNGGDKKKTEPKISDQIISADTASQVTSMLINVVEKGFGDGAKIPGYYFGGKTGTAQVAYENKKGYYPDKTIQSFIGFGPALSPEFLILVKLDNPKVPKSSLSAVPIFRKLSQYILDYWQIPPDYDVDALAK